MGGTKIARVVSKELVRGRMFKRVGALLMAPTDLPTSRTAKPRTRRANIVRASLLLLATLLTAPVAKAAQCFSDQELALILISGEVRDDGLAVGYCAATFPSLAKNASATAQEFQLAYQIEMAANDAAVASILRDHRLNAEELFESWQKTLRDALPNFTERDCRKYIGKVKSLADADNFKVVQNEALSMFSLDRAIFSHCP